MQLYSFPTDGSYIILTVVCNMKQFLIHVDQIVDINIQSRYCLLSNSVLFPFTDHPFPYFQALQDPKCFAF